LLREASRVAPGDCCARRHGGVHHARIVHSSGSELLDSETLALVAHAQPLPPPPPELADAEITIVVPIRYNIR